MTKDSKVNDEVDKGKIEDKKTCSRQLGKGQVRNNTRTREHKEFGAENEDGDIQGPCYSLLL